jgi:hypothetical protein
LNVPTGTHERFAIVCTKCSDWNTTAFPPEHCGNLGKFGKPP